ncbi:hypothetical protein HQ590_15230 [bacterium]|nr:hypothetical protein [bacterium]
MRYAILMGRIASLSCFLTCSPVILAETTSPPPRRVRELIVVGEPLASEITSTSPAVFAVSDKAAISLSHAHLYTFTPKKDALYFVYAESTLARLGLWLADDNHRPIAIADVRPEGQFRYCIRHRLERDVGYIIGVGLRDDTQPPIPYRVAVYDDPSVTFPPDPDRSIDFLQPGKQNEFSLSEHTTPLLGDAARYFRLRLDAPGKRWVRVRAASDDFSPMAVVVDPNTDEIVGEGWHNTAKRESEHHAHITGDSALVALVARKVPFEKGKKSDARFVLTATTHRTDPSSALGDRVRQWCADPVTAMAIGAIVALLVSYAFYRLSRIRRDITYDIISDRLVLRSSHTEASRLQVFRAGEQISGNVALCSLALNYRGRQDLKKEDVTSPIRLCLTPISSILRVNAELSAGWGDVQLVDGELGCIGLTVTHLDRSDHARLDVFYTQDSIEPLRCRPMGKLIDGGITAAVHRVERFRTVLGLGAGLAFLIGAATVGLDQLLDFLPVTTGRFITSSWLWLWIPWILYLLLDRDLRRAVSRFADKHLSRRRRVTSTEIRSLVLEPSAPPTSGAAARDPVPIPAEPRQTKGAPDKVG